MSKNLHIIPGVYTKYHLEEMFKNRNINDNILVFDSGMQNGALYSDFNENELYLRSENLKPIFEPFTEQFDFYKNIKPVLNYNYDKYDKITIWHGNTANELLNLYFLCKLIDRPIYTADVLLLKNKFPHLPQNPFLFTANCCSPENMKELYDNISFLTSDQKHNYAELWNR